MPVEGFRCSVDRLHLSQLKLNIVECCKRAIVTREIVVSRRRLFVWSSEDKKKFGYRLFSLHFTPNTRRRSRIHSRVGRVSFVARLHSTSRSFTISRASLQTRSKISHGAAEWNNRRRGSRLPGLVFPVWSSRRRSLFCRIARTDAVGI